MNKTLKKIKIASWTLLIIALIACLTGLCLYLYLPDQGQYTSYYFISAVIFIVALMAAQFVFFFLISQSLDHKRKQTDLKTADIVGSDIGAAYQYGKIGLIVIDSTGTVLWINNFLTDRGINIVDCPISTFSPELSKLLDDAKNGKDDKNSSVTIKYDGKYYEMRFLSSANLFILKDTTDVELLNEYNRDHALVIGYLNLDNFTDIKPTDELTKSDLENEVRKKIVSYFEKYNVLIRQMRSDYYMIMLARADFDKMIKDKFSIIAKIGKDYETLGLTISMGFGYGFPDCVHNSELASSSLDVALSRGGNQCVVGPFGEKMDFYGGGNTESKSRTSKVEIISWARSFVACLQHCQNVIIVPHKYADMDALGAALAAYSFAMSVNSTNKNFKAYIAYDPQLVESMADKAFRSLVLSSEAGIKNAIKNYSEVLSLKNKDTLVIMVDHNSPSQSIFPAVIDTRYDKIAVVDHHRKQNDDVNTVFEAIDSAASSTCELMSLFADSLQFKITIAPNIATLMLSGIYLDTNNFQQKTRILTHEACIILSRLKADEQRARDCLKEDYESFVIKSKILSSAKSYAYDILIAKADENSIVDAAMLASSCDELKEISGIKACFAIGKTSPTDVYVSSRGNGLVNCELLMIKLGGGGGHHSAAACQIKDSTVEEVYARLVHTLDEYLSEATIQKASRD